MLHLFIYFWQFPAGKGEGGLFLICEIGKKKELL